MSIARKESNNIFAETWGRLASLQDKYRTGVLRLPQSIQRPLFTTKELKKPLIDETVLLKTDSEQEKQTKIIAPSTANIVIFNPDQITLDGAILTKINSSEAAEKESIADDQSTEKPKLSPGHALTNVLPMFLPAPMGMLLNVLNTTQPEADTEKNRKKQAQDQGTGTEASSETATEENGKTSLWDSISSGFANIFKPITSPLTNIWSGIKKQINIEKFSCLFSEPFKEKVNNFISMFNKNDNSVKQKEEQFLREQAKKLDQEKDYKRYERKRIEQEAQLARQQRAAQEAKQREDQQRADQQVHQAALAERTQQQLKEQSTEALNLSATKKTSANKLSINESPKAKRAIASGLHLDLNKLSSNATEADLNTLITEAMIKSPGAGLAYLYSMGKDLYSLSNNTMFRSNDSVNMINVLTKYLNSGSDSTTAPKTINEYLVQQQGTTSLYKA